MNTEQKRSLTESFYEDLVLGLGRSLGFKLDKGYIVNWFKVQDPLSLEDGAGNFAFKFVRSYKLFKPSYSVSIVSQDGASERMSNKEATQTAYLLNTLITYRKYLDKGVLPAEVSYILSAGFNVRSLFYIDEVGISFKGHAPETINEIVNIYYSKSNWFFSKFENYHVNLLSGKCLAYSVSRGAPFKAMVVGMQAWKRALVRDFPTPEPPTFDTHGPAYAWLEREVPDFRIKCPEDLEKLQVFLKSLGGYKWR